MVNGAMLLRAYTRIVDSDAAKIRTCRSLIEKSSLGKCDETELRVCIDVRIMIGSGPWARGIV